MSAKLYWKPLNKPNPNRLSATNSFKPILSLRAEAKSTSDSWFRETQSVGVSRANFWVAAKLRADPKLLYYLSKHCHVELRDTASWKCVTSYRISLMPGRRFSSPLIRIYTHKTTIEIFSTNQQKLFVENLAVYISGISEFRGFAVGFLNLCCMIAPMPFP